MELGPAHGAVLGVVAATAIVHVRSTVARAGWEAKGAGWSARQSLRVLERLCRPPGAPLRSAKHPRFDWVAISLTAACWGGSACCRRRPPRRRHRRLPADFRLAAATNVRTTAAWLALQNVWMGIKVGLPASLQTCFARVHSAVLVPAPSCRLRSKLPSLLPSQVGQARKKFGIDYPAMYAPAGHKVRVRKRDAEIPAASCMGPASIPPLACL